MYMGMHRERNSMTLMLEVWNTDSKTLKVYAESQMPREKHSTYLFLEHKK